MRRFFALCSGELSGFSAPTDASALDVFKAALSAGQSNGVVRAFRITAAVAESLSELAFIDTLGFFGPSSCASDSEFVVPTSGKTWVPVLKP